MIKFFNNFKTNKLKAKSYKLNRGMSYVELIVVLSIFAALSSIVIYSYGGFQAKVDIKNLASDIALKVVDAQKSSLSGQLPLLVYPDGWKPSYGVYFKSSTSLDTDGVPFNKKFIYFANVANSADGLYETSPGCYDECIDEIIITKGDSIESLNVFYQDGSSDSLNDLTITFFRPNSGAVIKSSSLSGGIVSYVQITVQSAKSDDATAIIKIYTSGRIQVN